MANRAGLILTLAILSGGAAAFLAYGYLRQPELEVVPDVPADTRIIVAAKDLEAGHIVENDDVRYLDWPGRAIPTGYSTTVEEVVGHGLLAALHENEPMLSGKLASLEAGGGLPIMIPAGKRAVSVKVDDVIGVAGFTAPGTRVDVLATLDQGAQQSEPLTQVVLQNVEVLAAGQTTEKDVRGEPTVVPVVTLLVDPAQSEKLTLASTKGRIQLALRNPLDLDSIATPGIKAGRLLPAGIPPRRVVRRSATRAGVIIDVFRGPEKSSSTITPDGKTTTSVGSGS